MPETITRLLFTLGCVLIAQLANSADSADRPAPTAPHQAVLVTGASRGSGRLIAETLAKSRYLVYAGARKQADLEALDRIGNITRRYLWPGAGAITIRPWLAVGLPKNRYSRAPLPEPYS